MMSNALKLDNLDELNSHILQLQKEISDKQAILAALQHRKDQMYIDREKAQEKRPESLLSVVHVATDDSDNPNVGVDWVCRFTGRKKQTIYQWVHKRQIPHVKRGNRLSFNKNEIMEWWEAGRRLTGQQIEQNILKKL